jgi:hypothetical protein
MRTIGEHHCYRPGLDLGAGYRYQRKAGAGNRPDDPHFSGGPGDTDGGAQQGHDLAPWFGDFVVNGGRNETLVRLVGGVERIVLRGKGRLGGSGGDSLPVAFWA